jgi:hypothetical protein
MERKTDSIGRRLETERFLVITPEEMAELSQELEILERHGTLGEGSLLAATWSGLLLAVEQPRADEYTVRKFADRGELDLFLQRRLEQYERMWDGCGCRIDYYEAHGG